MGIAELAQEDGTLLESELPPESDELLPVSIVVTRMGDARPADEVAEAGEVMPQKSTFFYPKLASGLVLNPLDPAEPV